MDRLKNGKVVIFSAPSGAGKTTIVKRILSGIRNLEFSVSATSRMPREGEVNGKDYYFLDADDFRKRISEGAFLEWEEVYANSFYGTLKSEPQRIWDGGKHVIFDVDVMGGINIKKIFGPQALSLFIMPPSIEVLKERLTNRGTESPQSLQKRLDKASLEMSYAKQFDRIIVNDNLETAVEEAFSLVRGFIAS